MGTVRTLTLGLCMLTGGCGDYWALCIDDAVAAREEDDRVQVDVTLENCSLGADRDWPQGKEYCVEARWRVEGEEDEIDFLEACDEKDISLSDKVVLTFTSGQVIPADAGLNIEIDVVGAAGGPTPDSISIESP